MNSEKRDVGQGYEPLTISSEKAMKLVLALWIVVSHLPKSEPLGTFNYLPVAGFFFLSGYGLMKQKELGRKFRVVRSGLKLLIPFFICEAIYVALFVVSISHVHLTDIVRMVTFRSILLPYGWYVYTQLICYLIWMVASKSDKQIETVCLTCVGLLCYTLHQQNTSQILTSYKTVFAFVYGGVFCIIESREKERVSKVFRNLYLPIVSAVLACYIFNFLIQDESMRSAALFNVSGLLFCNIMIWFFYKALREHVWVGFPTRRR